MKPEVLCTGRLMPHIIEALDATYSTHHLATAADPAALLAQVGPTIRGIASGSHARCDKALMDACPGAEIISSFGVGVDHIDLDYARERGIILCNTPDVLNDEVANTAIMLLLASARKLVEYDRYVRAGRWVPEGDPALTMSIAGKKIGIVGLGRIGKAIADKLKAFHCEIVYFGRNEQPEVAYPYYSDLVAMAGDCTALIVITPGGPATRHMINEAVMNALGPQGHLINVARGSVVDEAALVSALHDGRLGNAGLDVFENEPEVPDALIAMDHIVLQPHQGSATVETRRAMGDRVVDNLAEHFAGNPPISRYL